MIDNEQAVLDESVKQGKRPKIVWAIFIYSMFGIFSLSLGVLMITGHLPMEESAKIIFGKLGIFDYFLALATPIIMFLASLMLFRLKTIAVKLFWINGLIYVVSQIYYLTIRGYATEYSRGTSGVVMHALGLALIVFLIYYSNKLKDSGILKP